MKILVTGITGFIGSRLACELAGGHHNIIGIVRKKRHNPELERLKIPVLIADLAKGFSLTKTVDIIVHTAGQNLVNGAKTEDYIRDNLSSMVNLLRYARFHKVKKFIFLSSISIYGKVGEKFVNENTPIVNPESYGLTKFLGERLLLEEAKWLPSVALRLPGIVGKGAKTCWLANIAKRLKKNEPIQVYNPGSYFNNMVYLGDLGKFVANILHNEFKGFEAVTLGCAEPLTVMETVQYLKYLLHSKSEVKIAESERTAFTISISKAEKMGYHSLPATKILDAYSKEV